MRVCYFYAKQYRRAVETLPPGAEMVYTGGSDTAYWEALCARWNKGDDLVTVEQDNVLHDKVIPEFEACKEIWCTFPYILWPVVPDKITELPFLWGTVLRDTAPPLPDAQCWRSLGATKFSAEFQERIPFEGALDYSVDTCHLCVMYAPDALCYKHIDCPMYSNFVSYGITEAHVHQPEVEHLHWHGENAHLLFF